MSKYEELLARVRYLNVDKNPIYYTFNKVVAPKEEKERKRRKLKKVKMEVVKPVKQKRKSPTKKVINEKPPRINQSNITEKTCATCSPNKPLPIDFFGYDSSTPSLRMCYCKNCNNAKKRNYYAVKIGKKYNYPKVPEGEKWCNKGQHSLPLDKFATDKSVRDGKCRTCTPCQVAAQRIRRENKKLAL